MSIISLLKSSAFMMTLALVVALLTNFGGAFPAFLDADLRSNLTILVLAIMLTVSLSRIPYRNLNPVKYPKSTARAVVLGLLVSALSPLIG